MNRSELPREPSGWPSDPSPQPYRLAYIPRIVVRREGAIPFLNRVPGSVPSQDLLECRTSLRPALVESGRHPPSKTRSRRCRPLPGRRPHRERVPLPLSNPKSSEGSRSTLRLSLLLGLLCPPGIHAEAVMLRIVRTACARLARRCRGCWRSFNTPFDTIQVLLQFRGLVLRSLPGFFLFPPGDWTNAAGSRQVGPGLRHGCESAGNMWNAVGATCAPLSGQYLPLPGELASVSGMEQLPGSIRTRPSEDSHVMKLAVLIGLVALVAIASLSAISHCPIPARSSRRPSRESGRD